MLNALFHFYEVFIFCKNKLTVFLLSKLWEDYITSRIKHSAQLPVLIKIYVYLYLYTSLGTKL